MKLDRAADLAIVGGGLAGGLIALAMRQYRPDVSVQLIEGGATLGGEHTWSFHDTDLDASGHALASPLIAHHWEGQRVFFPEMSRRLTSGYNSITSAKFHSVLASELGGDVALNRAVAQLTPTSVGFSDGEQKAFGAVIDCRGDRSNNHIKVGFQKFVGQVVRLEHPHGLDAPVIMDATVPQVDGYRFVYVLPFDEHTLLIEDTRYADGADLAAKELRSEIASYAQSKGWRIRDVLREETGALPIALAGDIDAFWSHSSADVIGNVARGGMRAALFHPLTGYSLPDAVGLALKIAHAPDIGAAALFDLTKIYSMNMWRKRAFYRLLTRMLFRAAAPDKRYKVLERFYKLPQDLIERFYAGQSTFADKARLLAGKPPVPVIKALSVLREASVMTPRNHGIAE